MDNRPFVVCHMICSIDGKIDGEFFNSPEVAPVYDAATQIRINYDCNAIMFGATTMAATYAGGFVAELPDAETHYDRTDYIAKSEVNNYFVTIDLKGTIAWESKYIEKHGRPRSHVIEVLTEDVSDKYLAYLRKFDISYLFAGKHDLDAELLLEKLKSIFGIDRLMICGGALTNFTFLKAGLIDELSLVSVPVIDGNPGTLTSFSKGSIFGETSPIALSLVETTILPGNGLWTRYKP